MQPRDALRPTAASRDRRDRQRRRVGCEDRIVLGKPVEVLEQRLLGVELLDDGLDDDICGSDLREIARNRDAPHRGVGSRRVEPPLLDKPGERA